MGRTFPAWVDTRTHMKKILSLLGNQFADPGRAVENTSTAMIEHNTVFQRAPDPDNILDREKARTQAITDEVLAVIRAVGTGQAMQQNGRTLSTAEFQTALDRLRDNRTGLDTSYFPATLAVRTKLKGLLYPNGMEPYNQANVQTLPLLINDYLGLVQDPENQAPEVFVTNSVDELTPYAAVRASQVQQMQQTSEARIRLRALVPRMEEQFTRNLHGLCFINPDDRSIVATYYNASLLEDQGSAHPGRYLGRVDKMHTNQVVNLAEANARYTSISLKVDETRDLYFYRTDDPRGPLPADFLRVNRDSPSINTLDGIPGTGAFLVAHNPSAYVGHYAVQLLA